MTRKLKTLGLALVVVFALSAMGASAASAEQAVITPGGAAVLGHDNAAGNTELTGALGIKCGTATYPGNVVGGTSIEVGLEFGGCKAGGVLPMTITPEGCKYVLTLGTLVSSTHADISAAHLVCPAGKQIIIHTYTGVPHTTTNCTLEFPSQTPTVNDLTVTDNTDGTLRIHGTLEGITNYAAPGNEVEPLGKNCVPATTQLPNSTLHVDMTVTGGVEL